MTAKPNFFARIVTTKIDEERSGVRVRNKVTATACNVYVVDIVGLKPVAEISRGRAACCNGNHTVLIAGHFTNRTMDVRRERNAGACIAGNVGSSITGTFGSHFSVNSAVGILSKPENSEKLVAPKTFNVENFNLLICGIITEKLTFVVKSTGSKIRRSIDVAVAENSLSIGRFAVNPIARSVNPSRFIKYIRRDSPFLSV